MPRRKVIFANSEVYHVFNKTIDMKYAFERKQDFVRATDLLWYYLHDGNQPSFSRYLRFNLEQKSLKKFQLQNSAKKCNVLAFCLMNTHFHLLIQQNEENGISKYMSDFQNSYTRYFNTKHERKGSLFLNQFKAVRVETTEQLIHVSRYIHLNPYSAFMVNSLEELFEYKWSSLPDYLGKERLYPWVDTQLVLSEFTQTSTYESFVSDQADYQRQLEKIKHLIKISEQNPEVTRSFNLRG